MSKILRSRRGSILIEAAIAFPVLIVILFGMVEFGVAYTVKRRNAQVASTAADLVAQVSSISTLDLQSIQTVGATILAPFSYSPTIGGLRITVVTQNANNATVLWSCAKGNLGAASGTYSLPSGLASEGQAVVIAEASYNFTPAIGQFLTGVVAFSAKAYNKPRLTASVALQGACP